MAEDVTPASSPAPQRTVGVGGVPLTVTTPAEPPTAGIVVVHEAFGITPALIAVCQRLSRHGYLAVAPNLYHRTASEPFETFQRAKPHLTSFTADGIAADIAGATEYLDAAGIQRRDTAIIGFCMGGTVALWQASVGRFGAAVTFYGGGLGQSRWSGVPAGVDSAAQLRCPWLGLYGAQDRSITAADLNTLEHTAAKVTVPTSVIRYPNAGHAFAVDPASRHYVADAAQDAWARALGWLDAHLR